MTSLPSYKEARKLSHHNFHCCIDVNRPHPPHHGTSSTCFIWSLLSSSSCSLPSINLKILCLRLHYWLYQYFYTVWQCKNTVRSYHLILWDSIQNSVWLYCDTVLQYHICSFGQYHMYWIALTNTIIVRVNRTLHVFWWYWVTVSNTSYSSMSNQIHCIRSRSISISTSINYSFNQYLILLYS